jgi:hypothetical protein
MAFGACESFTILLKDKTDNVAFGEISGSHQVVW